MSSSDIDFTRYAERVARALFGEPNARLSSKTELRFGSNGSKSVDLQKGTFYDHELGAGGGVVWAIETFKGLVGADARDWMRNDAGCDIEVVGKPNGRGGREQMSRAPAGDLAATYPYVDEQGELLFEVLRYYDEATGEKDFRQRHKDEHGYWINNIKGVRRVPYRLPELLEALSHDRTIFIVEGEKDVDNMWARGLPATCNPMGAGKWPGMADDLNPIFAGADVVIIADNDPQAKNKQTGELLYHPDGRPRLPGQDHANEVAASLSDVAARVRVLDLGKRWQDCPPKGDITDFFEAGGIVEALNAFVEQLPTWSPEQATTFALSLSEWLKRDFAAPDFLLGNWLTTTSRVLLFAPTGIGKTMFCMGMLMASAAGIEFLHWNGVRRARVLLIDGEMPRRLMRQRLADEVARRRINSEDVTFHILSREDAENFAPLNTPQGQAQIEREITKIGGVDLIGFDNISSLIPGDQKDGEVWRQTLPWVLSLTKRNIGQIWVHHTGHDEGHSYGDKTREFQMDTTIKLEVVEDGQFDVNFKLCFIKARERTPATRAEFADVKITLANDEWSCDAAPARSKVKVSPLGLKFLDALRDATIGNDANRMYGCPAARIEIWQAECVKHGLINDPKDHSDRTLFAKYKRELIAANRAASNDTMAWTL